MAFKQWSACALLVTLSFGAFGCVAWFDPQPEPKPLVASTPQPATIFRLVEKAYGEGKIDAAKDLDNLIRNYLISSDVKYLTSYLEKDGFTCNNKICAFTEIIPLRYDLHGGRDLRYSVYILLITFDDENPNAAQQFRASTVATSYRSAKP